MLCTMNAPCLLLMIGTTRELAHMGRSRVWRSGHPPSAGHVMQTHDTSARDGNRDGTAERIGAIVMGVHQFSRCNGVGLVLALLRGGMVVLRLGICSARRGGDGAIGYE